MKLKIFENLDWAIVDDDSQDSQDYDGEDESSDYSDREPNLKLKQEDSNDTKTKTSRNSESQPDLKQSAEIVESISEQLKVQEIKSRKDSADNIIQQISPEKTIQENWRKSQPSKRPPIPFNSQKVQNTDQQQQHQKNNQNQKNYKERNNRSRQQPFMQKSKTQQSDNQSCKTNPNSVYRKYYNKSIDFFVWTILHENPPYCLKLHIQAESPTEISKLMIYQSIYKEMNPKSQFSIDIRYFEQKYQFKVFLEFTFREYAIEFFVKFYKMPYLEICDSQANILFRRKMRAYLIYDEGTFEKLALLKYQEDEKNSNASGDRNTPNSSFGSQIRGRGKKKGGSYNGSSDESGGNFSISRGRGEAKKGLNNSGRSDTLPNIKSSSFEQEESKIIDQEQYQNEDVVNQEGYGKKQNQQKNRYQQRNKKQYQRNNYYSQSSNETDQNIIDSQQQNKLQEARKSHDNILQSKSEQKEYKIKTHEIQQQIIEQPLEEPKEDLIAKSQFLQLQQQNQFISRPPKSPQQLKQYKKKPHPQVETVSHRVITIVKTEQIIQKPVDVPKEEEKVIKTQQQTQAVQQKKEQVVVVVEEQHWSSEKAKELFSNTSEVKKPSRQKDKTNLKTHRGPATSGSNRFQTFQK